MGGEQDKVIALNSETIKDPTNVSMLMDFLSSKIDSYALLPNQAYYFPKDDTEYNINGKTFKFEETIAFVPKKHPDKHPNEINIISLAKGTKGKTNSSFAERNAKYSTGNAQLRPISTYSLQGRLGKRLIRLAGSAMANAECFELFVWPVEKRI